MGRRSAVVVSVLAFVAASAAALEPAEVVVVVNSAEAESVALGRFYCAKRGVPETHLVALDLPTDATISAEAFETKLRRPLREAIAERGLADRVRCLLTVRGVPYRLAADQPPEQIEAIIAWCGEAAQRARRRVARNILLLERIGTDLPPGTAADEADPEDLSTLFADLPEPPSQADRMDELVRRFSLTYREKAGQLNRFDDPARRAVAGRQLVGLYLDTFGQVGWPAAVKVVGPDVLTVPADYARRISKARDEAVRLMKIPNPDPRIFAEVERHLRITNGAVGIYGTLTDHRARIADRPTDSRAAVDSELSLLFWDEYVREEHLPNYLMWRHASKRARIERQYGRVLMVSRLDGPSAATVMRMVLDGLAAEDTGLSGTCYVDLAGPVAPSRAYQKDMMELAHSLHTYSTVPVKADLSVMPFGPDECPQAALYVGWHSPNKYIDAFDWQTGAIGFHVAATEALDLRDGDSRRWVPRLLASGVVATMGAADETNVTAFPSSADFYALLLTGKLTVAEAYWRTTPLASWRLMLLADPLYCPFRNAPQELELSPHLMPGARP